METRTEIHQNSSNWNTLNVRGSRKIRRVVNRTGFGKGGIIRHLKIISKKMKDKISLQEVLAHRKAK